VEDSGIIEMYFQRNEQAVQETSSKYSAYCHSISYNILRNQEDAEECVNDVLAKVWGCIPPQKPQNLKAFLGKLTRNHSLNMLEKQQAEKRGGGEHGLILDELENIIASNSIIEDELRQAEILQAINEFLKGLPKNKRVVFVRRYWYLNSIAEIAHMYKISEGKVKSMLFRTRSKLKDHLQKEELL